MDILNKNIELIKDEIGVTIIHLQNCISVLMKNRSKNVQKIQERSQALAGMHSFLDTLDNFLCDDILIPTIMMDFHYLTYWIDKLKVSDREKFDTLMEIIKRNYKLMHLEDGRKVIVMTKEDSLFINKNREMQDIFNDGKKVTTLLDKYYAKEKLTDIEVQLVQILLTRPNKFEKNIQATTSSIYQKYFADKSIHDLDDVSSIMDSLTLMGVNDSMLSISKKCLLNIMHRLNKISEDISPISFNKTVKKESGIISEEEYKNIRKELKQDVDLYTFCPKRFLTVEEKITIGRKLLLINTPISFVKSFFNRVQMFNQYLDEEHTILKSPQLIFKENYARYEFYKDYGHVSDAIDTINLAMELLEQEIDVKSQSYLESEILKEVSYLEQVANHTYKYEFQKIQEKGKIFIKDLEVYHGKK